MEVKMKRISSLIGIILVISLLCVTGFAMEEKTQVENDENRTVLYYVMIYNYTPRTVALWVANTKPDFKQPSSLYFQRQGKERYPRLVLLKPNDFVSLRIFRPRPDTFRKGWGFNLIACPWMVDKEAFTQLNLRLSILYKEKEPKPRFNNGKIVNNIELGQVSASPITFTTMSTYDSDAFHKDIVRKMGLNPDKGFGKIVYISVKLGMKVITKGGCGWGSLSEYYYEVSISNEHISSNIAHEKTYPPPVNLMK
jgi:hypothetical protein